jgi:hypothetical protein
MVLLVRCGSHPAGSPLSLAGGRSARRSEHTRDLPQHDVTLEVAVTVVDALEVVEVEHGQPEALVEALRPLGLEERADARTRTGDPFITSEVLYQLSYVGGVAKDSPRGRVRSRRRLVYSPTSGTVRRWTSQ